MQTAAMGELEPQRGATGVRIDRERGLVHRRTGPWTPAVHALMAHARANGVPEAPEVVGFDEDGDELLVYVDGDDGRGSLSEARLRAVGALTRRVADALATFTGAGGPWRSAEGGPVLAHGDIAPWNLVFRGDDVAGLLDWDFAGRTPPLYDLAYAAWTCVPLEPDELPLEERRHRLRTLADAYGASARERSALLEIVAYAQTRVAFHVARGGMSLDLGLPGLWREGRHVGQVGRAMTWLDEHRDELESALR